MYSKYVFFLIISFVLHIVLFSCGGNGGQWEFEGISEGDSVSDTIVFSVHGGRLDSFQILCEDGIDYKKIASIQYYDNFYEITLDTTNIPNGDCVIAVETISEHSDFDSPAPEPASLSITIDNEDYVRGSEQ